MPKPTGQPDEARVAFLYQKLSGKKMERGSWNAAHRDLAQKIAYVEDACRSVLEEIENLNKAEDPEDIHEAVQRLKKEFSFLQTLDAYSGN